MCILTLQRSVGTWWEMNLRKPKVTEADLLVSYNSDPGEMDLRLG